MTTQNYFILTSAQRAAAMSDDNSSGEIDPRAVDNASPGTGINLNDAASSYQAGDAVTLTGTFVAPKRIVDDPAYSQTLKIFLLTLPWATLENETIFAPAVD